MYATDFEYDSRWLSDYNCIVCDFEDSSGTKVASAGSSITFNKITRDYGRKNSLSGIQYDQCITATFDICKNPEVTEKSDLAFTSDECRDIMRWLNRGAFYKFRVLYDNSDIDQSKSMVLDLLWKQTNHMLMEKPKNIPLTSREHICSKHSM